MKKRIKKRIYEDALGKLFLNGIIKNRVTNKLAGRLANTMASKLLIPKFCRMYNIDSSKFKIPEKGFRTLNQFFTREYLEMPSFNSPPGILHSPAEGYLSVQENINPDSIIQAKGITYSLKELLKENPKKSFRKGTFIRIRLTPKEYHHFHYIDNGKIKSFRDIFGKYYTSDFNGINNIKKIFCRSHRNITEIFTENLGEIIYAEIGATFVGSIIQNNKIGDSVLRGNKKGCFKFGGSTVIIIFEKGKICLDRKILRKTRNNEEVYVSLGEILGKSKV